MITTNKLLVFFGLTILVLARPSFAKSYDVELHFFKPTEESATNKNEFKGIEDEHEAVFVRLNTTDLDSAMRTASSLLQIRYKKRSLGHKFKIIVNEVHTSKTADSMAVGLKPCDQLKAKSVEGSGSISPAKSNITGSTK